MENFGFETFVVPVWGEGSFDTLLFQSGVEGRSEILAFPVWFGRSIKTLGFQSGVEGGVETLVFKSGVEGNFKLC